MWEVAVELLWCLSWTPLRVDYRTGDKMKPAGIVQHYSVGTARLTLVVMQAALVTEVGW